MYVCNNICNVCTALYLRSWFIILLLPSSATSHSISGWFLGIDMLWDKAMFQKEASISTKESHYWFLNLASQCFPKQEQNILKLSLVVIVMITDVSLLEFQTKKNKERAWGIFHISSEEHTNQRWIYLRLSFCLSVWHNYLDNDCWI